jgi:hypothetical protein
MEENIVHIVEWPKMPAVLEHGFPKPVDINIPNPVGLNMFNSEDRPLNLNLHIKEGQVIPICIKLCEPICAESNYKIGLNLMGQPFIEIVVQGITRLFNCRDKGTPGTTGTPTNPNNEGVVIK